MNHPLQVELHAIFHQYNHSETLMVLQFCSLFIHVGVTSGPVLFSRQSTISEFLSVPDDLNKKTAHVLTSAENMEQMMRKKCLKKAKEEEKQVRLRNWQKKQQQKGTIFINQRRRQHLWFESVLENNIHSYTHFYIVTNKITL